MEVPDLKASQLRLRVFAGPNGSGKTTMIKFLQAMEIGGRALDFGIYINADDITEALLDNTFSFKKYSISINENDIEQFLMSSGLLNAHFTIEHWKDAVTIKNDTFKLLLSDFANRVAQVVARFLREQMLLLKRKFSFETVFSHESNVEIMKRAAELGYKVYLYFVSTESPEINIYRVKLRVQKGGHDVDQHKIRSRYMRAMELMGTAAPYCYQAYFFDNSITDTPLRAVAVARRQGEKLIFDDAYRTSENVWFNKYFPHTS